MHKVAFVTQKGGAGKSTLASNVAVAAHKAGERVFICDLDPLQSLVKWSRARKTLDIPVQHMPPDKLEPALEELAKEGVTLVIIDTPAADSSYSEQAVLASDLCVIPARPNALDLWASEVTLAKVRACGKDYAFLLNQCPPAQQSVRVERGAQALQEMGALLSPLISTRVDYQEAVRLGLGVGELNPAGAAAREMRRLWTCLHARLMAKAEAEEKERAARALSDAVALPYRDFFDQAIKVHDLYAGFLSAFIPFRYAQPPRKPAPDAPPASPKQPRRLP